MSDPTIWLTNNARVSNWHFYVERRLLVLVEFPLVSNSSTLVLPVGTRGHYTASKFCTYFMCLSQWSNVSLSVRVRPLLLSVWLGLIFVMLFLLMSNYLLILQYYIITTWGMKNEHTLKYLFYSNWHVTTKIVSNAGIPVFFFYCMRW